MVIGPCEGGVEEGTTFFSLAPNRKVVSNAKISHFGTAHDLVAATLHADVTARRIISRTPKYTHTCNLPIVSLCLTILRYAAERRPRTVLAANRELQSRLRGHARAFEGLMSLIPAKDYYGKDESITSVRINALVAPAFR